MHRTEYIATRLLRSVGVKPAGDNGTWYQAVPLTGAETKTLQKPACLSSDTGLT